MTLVATQVKRRRGTGAENDAFTGAEGEITVDLTNKEVRVHTGDNKVGGYGLARKDFENLTDKAKNIGLWCNNAANIITEIPQDIKLELNNGTLTLKAGSKVYVPNGVGVFDEITIASDLTKTGTANAVSFLVYDTTINDLRLRQINESYSGSTTPTSSTNEYWYDTTNNRIGVSGNSGSTWTYGCSLPLAVIGQTSSVITSIEQIFNGFGYIGSTAFVLPSVKGLIPNGRNSDGTLNNTAFTVSSVLTVPSGYNGRSVTVAISNNAISVSQFYFQQNKQPSTIGTLWFRPDENKMYRINNSGVVVGYNQVPCVTIDTDNSGKITSMKQYGVFQALDYSDTDFIGHQAMPSGRYINLTVGASGSTYTAPANGYFCVRRGATSVNQYTLLINRTASDLQQVAWTPINGGGMHCFVPVSAGDIVDLSYSASTTSTFFRFVYANGAQ